MKNLTYLKLFLVSVSAALVLSLISILCLIKFSDISFRPHRLSLLQFVARSIETNPKGLVLPDIPFGPPREGPRPPHRHDDFPPPPPPGGPGGMMGRPPGPPPGGPEFPEFWIISASDQVVAGDEKRLPKAVMGLAKPTDVHGLTSTDRFWNFFDRTSVMRLDHEPAAYLVIFERRNPFRGPLFFTQGIFTFATVVVALFLALTITFSYLRQKSEEARSVLLRLERGDLKARFEIKPFDEFGGLLLDFNRMAHEIERLVNRVRETESARSHLLSELGHDLRTPLTSLTTSFETLKFHFKKMTDSDRDEVFTMITAEVEYFKELLEKLMTIAELDEPHYKKSTDLIDLSSLVQQELRFRQSSSAASGKDFSFTAEGLNGQQAMVLGDSYLLLRLLKNAVDNASRYAKSKVMVAIVDRDEHIEVSVADDGPGMDQAGLANFGKRQERRKRREEGTGLNFSLGLGSVIMKTIAELHGGSLEVGNIENEQGIQGAILKVRFPKSKNA
ncbi:sensor histidine kinase [Bdellovibrio svalbardensis]|uniref:histidine kinase n=1 Tax=Bdellovibrio svalbardensis TaxID=2972972 RepID=A0ABT6DFE0_9BACT|nr:HAMP domain-containing sensor histidine kinase [Bdellovibrio svalbardensis]MDG0815564.1 HAMP domain-containing histidine kinase [Bdellovibrio svalbardensis]